MAEGFEQGRRDIEIALGRVGIHRGGGAPDDGFHHPRAGAAKLDLAAVGFELGPGRPSRDIEIGAEAQGIDRSADAALQIAQALQIDHRDIAGGMVGEAVAWGMDHPQRPRGGLAQKFGQPAGEGVAPLRLVQVAFEWRQPLGFRMQHAGVLVIGRPGLGHLGHLGQHGEAGLGDEGRGLGIETGRAVLDGIEPVAGEEMAGFQPDASQPFRREALDRVATEGGDAAGHGA